MCLHPLGPWAEYLRALDLKTAADLGSVRAWVWAIKLPDDLVRNAFQLSLAASNAMGLAPGALVDDDYRACQDFAEVRRTDPSFSKVWRVPSAALPGTENLVVFGPRVAIPYLTVPIDPDIDTPASVLAGNAVPPTELLSLVRYRGEPHRGYVEWLAGRTFEFQEPVFSV